MLPCQGLLVLARVHLTLARVVLINRSECTSVTIALTACVGEGGFWLKCAEVALRQSIRELGSICPYRDLFLGSQKHTPFASG